LTSAGTNSAEILSPTSILNPIFHSLFDVQTIFSKIPGIPGVGSGLFDDTESLFTSRHKT
ncbi:MAG TPA: hypothetical protein VGO18_26145, partial [Steroidobacteraceae bacterium]|nr:hypothetical protein [Steroidobacteraceae bacterium]